MFDAALRRQNTFPPAGQTVILDPVDLGLDTGAFSTNWRALYMVLRWPAMPEHTDSTKIIQIDLYLSSDGGATYALFDNIAVIPGVATTGSPASSGDFLGRPWKKIGVPPSLAGPLQLRVTVPAGAPDLTRYFFTLDFTEEA